MLPDNQELITPNRELAHSISPLRIDSLGLLPTVQRMMVAQFDLKIENLVPEAQLESLGVDSLSVIEFMFALEDEFKIRLPDERVELKTIGDVVNILGKIISTEKAFA